MTRYAFRCREHGVADHDFRMGEAPSSVTCVRCGQPARRVFSSPMLTTHGAAGAALDLAARSAERPELTTAIPTTAAQTARSPRPASPGSDPRHRRLPRP